MIKIKNMSFKYPDGRLVLNAINLNIKNGEFVAIVGKNGSGKSTLLRHLNGLLLPSEGIVEINGLNTHNENNLLKIRKNVCMVFQNPDTQFIGMTVEEDVAFGLENLGVHTDDIREQVSNILQKLNLQDIKEKSLLSLSGGQKQKVAIAGALIMQSECMVFDEVTSMLNTQSQKEIMEIIKQLHKNGKTVLYATHELEETLYADRIIIMDNGKIVVNDIVANVFLKEVEQYGLKVPDIIQLSKKLLSYGVLQLPLPLDAEDLMERLCQ